MISSLAFLAVLLAPVGQPNVALSVGLWSPMDQRAEHALRLISTRYRELHPHVTIALYPYAAKDAYGYLTRWCDKERAWRPDVVLVPEVWLSQVADDLDPPSDATIARMRAISPKGMMDRASVGGIPRALPFTLEPQLLFYWTDLIGQKNWQPGSWNEVLDVTSRARQKTRVWGLGVPGHSAGLTTLFGEILWSLGGQFFGPNNANGTPSFNLMSSKAEHALDVLVRCDRDGIAEPQMLTWSLDELASLFVDRKLTAIVAPSALEEAVAPKDRAKLGVAPLPGRPIFTYLSVDDLAVFKTIQGGDPSHAAAAQEFLALAASPDGQKCIAKAGGLPLDQKVAARDVKSAALKAAMLGMNNLRGLPRHNSTQLVAAVDRAVWLAVSGRMLSPRALEEGQALLPVKLAE